MYDAAISIGASGAQTSLGSCQSTETDEAWNNGTSGKFNSSMSFDGTDDYATLTSGPNLQNKSFSVSAWLKRGSIGSNHFALLHGTTTDDDGLQFGFRASDKLTFAFYYNDLDSENTYTDTDWHHWVGTYDAETNERILYRDGVMENSDTADADFQAREAIG